MTREKNEPRPRAIQPCLSITASPVAFHTETAHTAVRISMMIKAAKRVAWPTLSRFMVAPFQPLADEQAKEIWVPCVEPRPSLAGAAIGLDKAELRSLTNGLPSRTNVCTRRKRTCSPPRRKSGFDTHLGSG